ncbi:transcriptional regulator, Cro, CI family [Enterococcus sp. 5H]|nr:XRE family transcriptional regulator [Enterococcus sp. 5H]MDA9472023.1 transcriptional regulator, Cro, CI family [Enterococcus sp. 5H]
MGFTQAELYKDIFSKVSYYNFEKGEKSIDLDQLAAVCTRLSMRPTELLYRADFTRLDSIPFWKNKMELVNHLESHDQFHTKYADLERQKYFSIGDYSIFIAFSALGMSCGYIDRLNLTKNDLKKFKKYYKKRTIFFAVDYEILANLTFFLPDLDLDINFLINKLFPLEESFGEVFDISVQNALKNLVSYHVSEKNFEESEKFLNQFKKIRTINNFNINSVINLEVVYLEHINNFYKNRTISDFLEATKMVNLFEKLGYTQLHKKLVSEISGIAESENFQLPDDIVISTKAYSNE